MPALINSNETHETQSLFDNQSHLTRNGTNLVAQVPLLPPALLACEKPMTAAGNQTAAKGRQDATDIVTGRSDRLLVIVGPRFFEDFTNAHEYALALRELNQRFEGELCIMMRASMEKSGAHFDGKGVAEGLLNDPEGDSSFQLNKGLQICRQLLVELNALGVPIAYEMRGVMTSQFLGDCMSTALMDGSATGSEMFHQLGSSLPCPVGFEGTADHGAAADSIQACASSHHFIGMTEQGLVAIKHSPGNKAGFVVLRDEGKDSGLDTQRLQGMKNSLKARGQNSAILVDCSTGKDKRHDEFAMTKSINSLLRQGDDSIHGAIMEPIVAENGDHGIDFERTVNCLEQLASGVRARREMIQLRDHFNEQKLNKLAALKAVKDIEIGRQEV